MFESRRVRLTAVASVCALAGAAAGIAGATASSTGSPRTGAGGWPPWPAMGHGLPSASQIQKRVQQGVGPLGRLGALGIGGPPVHAQLVVPNGSGGFQAITVDSGTVGSVSASTLTVDEAYDGHTYQDVPITIPSGAVVQRDGSTVSLSNLRSGDEVTVARSSSTTRVFAWHAQQAPGPFGEHWPGVPGSMHFFGMP